jgi:ring-1,2-phenylacetyl-CoA epoxidase subunit PaaD
MVTTSVSPQDLLVQVRDPELPFLTIADLGILRRVEAAGSQVRVTITPTYSGCPALEAIRDDIDQVLSEHGFEVEVVISLSPPWTTDDLSPEAHSLLARHGMAPPQPEQQVRCPRCDSSPARVVSRFGSTACKALMVCSGCGEPFDLFKELR